MPTPIKLIRCSSCNATIVKLEDLRKCECCKSPLCIKCWKEIKFYKGERMTELYVLRACGSITHYNEYGDVFTDQEYEEYSETWTAEAWQKHAEACQKHAEFWQSRVEYYQKEVEDRQKRADYCRKQAEAYQKHAKYYQKEVEYWQKRADYCRKQAEAYQKHAKYYQKEVEYWQKRVEYGRKQAEACQKEAKFCQSRAKNYKPDWRAFCLAELKYYQGKLKLECEEVSE